MVDGKHVWVGVRLVAVLLVAALEAGCGGGVHRIEFGCHLDVLDTDSDETQTQPVEVPSPNR